MLICIEGVNTNILICMKRKQSREKLLMKDTECSIFTFSTSFISCENDSIGKIFCRYMLFTQIIRITIFIVDIIFMQTFIN